MTNEEFVNKAQEKGFALCRFLPPEKTESEHKGLVTDPREVIDDAQAVILLFMRYKPANDALNSKEAVISPYYLASHRAYRMAKELAALLVEKGYKAVSSVQLPLKKLMLEYGIGEIGRNTLVTVKGLGSCFHVQAIVTNARFEFTNAKTSHLYPAKRCEHCHRCVKACPNRAIRPDMRIDTTRCLRAISELDPIPEENETKLYNRLLGCDVCQSVCPANLTLEKGEAFEYELKRLINGDVKELKDLIGTNNARTRRLQKKGAIIAANLGRRDLIDDIRQQSLSGDDEVAKAMRRALKRLEEKTCK